MNQYLGDGFLCYWDHEPETPERVTALLCHFAGIQRGAEPPFRVVLHFGSVVLGSDPLRAQSSWPQVNFVFRMEKLAAGLGETLLLSNEAADALGLPIRTKHETEIAGFDGKFSFSVPELEGCGAF